MPLVTDSHHHERGATLVEVSLIVLPFLSVLSAFLVFAMGFVSLGMVSQDVLYAEIGNTTQKISSPSLTLQNLIQGHGATTARVGSSINTYRPFNPTDPEALSVASYVAGPARARHDAIGLPMDYAVESNPIPYTATTISVSDGEDRDMDGVMDPRVVVVGRYFMPFFTKLVVSASIVRRSKVDRPTVVSGVTNRTKAPPRTAETTEGKFTICKVNCPIAAGP